MIAARKSASALSPSRCPYTTPRNVDEYCPWDTEECFQIPRRSAFAPSGLRSLCMKVCCHIIRHLLPDRAFANLSRYRSGHRPPFGGQVRGVHPSFQGQGFIRIGIAHGGSFLLLKFDFTKVYQICVFLFRFDSRRLRKRTASFDPHLRQVKNAAPRLAKPTPLSRSFSTAAGT